MSIIYLSIGSNKGNRYSIIKEAIALIGKDVGKIILISKIYETKSWGFESDDFLNLCIKIKSRLEPIDLLNSIKNIEKIMGRKEELNEIAAREIDIDIIFYSNKVIDQKNLKIPHPRLELRNFVLFPLNDIAANHIHPISLRSVKQILEKSNDKDIPKVTSLNLP